ncbi:DUF4865 family protein [Phyllobacterium sp. YR531]|uniref:DUF4865 family protein n=1 Tax=Phyllobacterium sp. YR531 TaxID=1144343 RepID=UPI00026F9895|nr:DUF4865 family protein [Phyllobacterium sp. YR531]EJN04097.1 hypothetical protein PMI41_01734 [Phyllobacterium sp. YR531]
MIAMQYSFPLPADYDMGIIDRRIAEKGPLLDNFPNLAFKAYLTGRREDETQSQENLYAPFYLWRHESGLNDFVCGAGFAAVSQSFGRPSIKTWIVWQAEISPSISSAAFATREILPIEPYASLAELRRGEEDQAVLDVQKNSALAAVSAFNPTDWTRIRFRLWGEQPHLTGQKGHQTYKIGHLSLPKAD